MLNEQNINSDEPRAFMVYMMLDENFEIDPEASGALQTENPDVLGELAVTELSIRRNGYLYVYVNNNSEQPVFFDNLLISHTSSKLLEENNYYPFGMLWKAPVGENKYKYNGKEIQTELDLFTEDYGARQYDPANGRWVSVDPLAHKLPWQSPYAAFDNNPINKVDDDGRYAVSVHYRITYNTLIKIGYSAAIADNIAHHASTYADHPEPSVLFMDNAMHGTNNAYRGGIDYSKTQFSQEEWHSNWHSMMSDQEAESGMTHGQATQRGLAFGWKNIFDQQKGEDIGKLGQGLHALQDAYAHKGASTDEHLGKNNLGIYNESARNMLYNDAYGNTDQADLITQSAGIVLQLFKGNTSSLQNGMSLDFTGLSSDQLKTTQGLFGKAGYNLNEAKEKGNYTLQKIDQK